MAVRQELVAAGFVELRPGDVLFLALLAMGADTIEELASRLDVSEQAIGKTVDSMVARSLVARTADDADRRRVTLTSTPAGARAAGVARSGRLAPESRFVAALGEAHACALLDGLRAFAESERGEAPRLRYSRRSRPGRSCSGRLGARSARGGPLAGGDLHEREPDLREPVPERLDRRSEPVAEPLDDRCERVDREARVVEAGRALGEVESGELEQAVAVVGDDVLRRCLGELALELLELGPVDRLVVLPGGRTVGRGAACGGGR